MVLRPAMLGLHLLGVVAVAFTVSMGLWQLGAYDAQQLDESDDRSQAAAVALHDALGPDDAFGASADGRRIEATGRFAPADRQLWVSGRSHDGRDGYWLVSPFVTGGSAAHADALLVVRGWSPEAGPLPGVPDATRIEAVLQPTEESAGPLDVGRMTDALSIPLLANELPYDLYAGFGIQTAPPPDGELVAVPPPDPGVSWTVGLRNLVYAVQWWVFGAFAVFFWYRMCRDLVSERRAAERGTSEW